MSDPFIPLGPTCAVRLSTILAYAVLPASTGPTGTRLERRLVVHLAVGAVPLYGADMDRAIDALVRAGVATEALRAEMCEPPTVDIAAPGRA